jgi:predicted transcriptional regulator
MRPRSIGDQELALLQYVAEKGGTTVGQAAEEFGAARGLARSTVLTMMERLRAKGHLERGQVDGVYRYFSPATPGEVMQDVVKSFVEKTLGGSVSPFVTYLTETAQVSDADLAELEELVAKLQSNKKKEPEA